MTRFATLLALLSYAAPAVAQGDPVFSSHPGSIDYAILERPLTPPQGTLEVDVRLAQVRLSIDVLGESISSSATAALAGVSYAVSDQLEVGALTALSIDPDFEWGEVLGLRAGFLVMNTDLLALAPTVWVPINLGDGDALNYVGIGADLRIGLTDSFAVLAGHNLLTLGFGDFSYSYLNLNVAAAYQPIGMMALRLDTSLASVAISGDNTETVTIGDAQLIGLSAIVSPMDMLDVFVGVTIPDIGDAGSLYIISGGVTLRPLGM